MSGGEGPPPRRTRIQRVLGLLAMAGLTAISVDGLRAQQVVTGRVLDASHGQPLPAAQVSIVGTTIAVFTDSTGAFRLPIDAGVEAGATDVLIAFRALGYMEAQRSIALPPRDSVTVALQPRPLALDGIEARARRVVTEMDTRLRAVARGLTRVATEADLRAFDPRADAMAFMPQMGVVGNTGCATCFMMAGRFQARFFVDELEVDVEEFRSYRLGEFCRLEVVRITHSPDGGIHAYTCDFMQKVIRGRAPLAPVIPVWWQIGGRP